jgi:hypothetical protein
VRVAGQTQDRLVIESKPKFAFGIAIALGAVALLSALYSLVFLGEAPSKGNIFGLILGPLFLGGGLLLYRETTTIFDRKSGSVTWEQRGLMVRKADIARFDEINDLVIGRPASDESGGATRLSLILKNRVFPLMFGFSGCNRDAEIREVIRGFINHGKP